MAGIPDEPVYGREALRRLRERQAAEQQKKTALPKADKRPALRCHIKVATNPKEQTTVRELAQRSGLTLSNYFRVSVGMPAISAGRPDPRQEASRKEWARTKLAELVRKS